MICYAAIYLMVGLFWLIVFNEMILKDMEKLTDRLLIQSSIFFAWPIFFFIAWYIYPREK